MTELMPGLGPGYYVHPAVRLERAIVEKMDGQVIEHMSRQEFREQCERDVAADPNSGMAIVYPDEERGTVTMVMDERTAAVVIHAVRAFTSDKEAHAREVLAVAERMPEGSYGRKNREEIATRSGRVGRLGRMVVDAYQKVIDKEYWGM